MKHTMSNAEFRERIAKLVGPAQCPFCGKTKITDTEGPTIWYLCCGVSMDKMETPPKEAA